MDVLDHDTVISHLTEGQKKCLLDLSIDWQDSGYCRITADILYGIAGSSLWPESPELVDCEFYNPENQSGRYRHRLLPAGQKIKDLLLKQ